MAKKALNLTDTLARVFLARLLPGENPALFQSPHLTMELYRQQASDALPHGVEISGGSFSLPSDLSLSSTSGFTYLDRNVSQ